MQILANTRYYLTVFCLLGVFCFCHLLPFLNSQGLRSKMTKGIKNNFKKQHEGNMNCALNCNITHVDSQENLFICEQLRVFNTNNTVKHSDIFSDIHSQLRAVKVFIKILETRENMLKK